VTRYLMISVPPVELGDLRTRSSLLRATPTTGPNLAAQPIDHTVQAAHGQSLVSSRIDLAQIVAVTLSKQEASAMPAFATPRSRPRTTSKTSCSVASDEERPSNHGTGAGACSGPWTGGIPGAQDDLPRRGCRAGCCACACSSAN
jgi:hypothetical protein